MSNKRNNYLVLAYETDSPEFICVGTYETQIQAYNAVDDSRHLFHNKRLLIARILKEIPNV